MSAANGNSLHSLVGHSLASGVGEQVVYTPDALAAGIVGHFRPTGRLCEPCKGGGAFLRAMPGADWFEIAEGRDFLTAVGRWDWIVTNPPWRELGPFLDKAMDCADNVVFLAWAAAWWSKARQRKIEAAGFGMAEMLLCPTPPKPWPQSGFLLGAVWLRRGWHGGLTISRMPNIEINIDLDKKCAECGKSGAMDSGICMKCVLPAMQGKPMKSEQGRAMQKRLKVVLKKTSI